MDRGAWPFLISRNLPHTMPSISLTSFTSPARCWCYPPPYGAGGTGVSLCSRWMRCRIHTLSEYQILRILAQSSRNLVLAGDFDQTIYEWRGSTPDRILRRFHADFPEAREFSFEGEPSRDAHSDQNGGGRLPLRTVSAHRPRPAQTAPIGEPIIVHFAGDSTIEAEWIAR